MTGTITKIHELKGGKRFNAAFYRVEFDIEGKWAKTDLCPTYRNFAHWKPLLKVGAVLGGLRFRQERTEVDADAKPWLIRWTQLAPRAARPEPIPDPQMQLL